jgi:hypothetical protein
MNSVDGYNSGHKTALEEAVAIARAEELARGPSQADLFGDRNGESNEGPADSGGQPGPLAPSGTHGPKKELQASDDQMEFFEASALCDERPIAKDSSRRGRPVGARNLRTDQASRWYMARHGDPLERGIAVAALPVLAKGVLEALSIRLGCSTYEAAKWWASVYSATLPFVHQRLATLTVKPVGSPGGEPVSWTFTDDGELADVSCGGFDDGQELGREAGCGTDDR